jgi:hypothetical protein
VLFREIRAFIRLNFSTVDIVYAPQSFNKLAHELAGFSASHDGNRGAWIDTVPDDVMHGCGGQRVCCASLMES